MGPVGRTGSTDRFLYPFLIDLQYILLLLYCSSPRYPRNIPYTKIRGFGMQISCSRIFGISSRHFFLSNIPWIPKRSFWAGYLPVYVYGRGILLLLLFLLLSTGIIVLVFLLFPIASHRKIFSFCIMAQTLYGTCNSISYVLNFLCLCFLFS